MVITYDHSASITGSSQADLLFTQTGPLSIAPTPPPPGKLQLLSSSLRTRPWTTVQFMMLASSRDTAPWVSRQGGAIRDEHVVHSDFDMASVEASADPDSIIGPSFSMVPSERRSVTIQYF